MQRYINITICLVLLAVSTASSQNTLSTHFMRDIWQSNATNPAFVPKDDKVFIALPSFDGFYNLSKISLSKIIDYNNGIPVVNLSDVSDAFKEETYFKANTSVNALSFAFKIKNLTIGIETGAQVESQLVLRKGLIELFSKGNAPFIGKEVEVGPRLDVLAYYKIGIGAAYQLDKLSLGLKLKSLRGLASIETEKSSAIITTSDDIYQITAATDYLVNANVAIEYDSINGIQIEDFELGNNNGFAFDIGASYDISEKLSVGLSIVDVGSVKFKNNTSSYKSQGSFVFNGIEVDSLFSGGKFSVDVSTDSIINTFKVNTTVGTSYSHKLPTKVYLSGIYNVSEKLQIGALYHLYNYGNNNSHAIQLSGRFNWKAASLGMVYGVRDGSFDNLGLNLALKLGPVQIYGLTDNILTVFRPFSSHGINLGIGMNVAW